MHTQNLCTEGKYEEQTSRSLTNEIIPKGIKKWYHTLHAKLHTSNTLLLKPSPSNLNFIALTKMNLEEKIQKLIDKILYMKHKAV